MTLEDKVKEFFLFLDKWEESDSGREFRPNVISSCRCLDAPKIGKILMDMRTLVGLPEPRVLNKDD